MMTNAYAAARKVGGGGWCLTRNPRHVKGANNHEMIGAQTTQRLTRR